MNAVVQMFDTTPRSLVEERAIRPPIIGKIRPGIKVLTRTAQANPQAVALYNEMVAAGDSYETIGKTIESKLKLRNALVPRNVSHFACRRSDFSNPETADEILRLYGEDRGGGVKLHRFPVIFAFDDWLRNVPNQMAAYTTAGRQYFSEYERDGKRYCKTYAPVQRDARVQRARRSFGGRLVVQRQDDDIPDGICDPHVCPQYQDRKCNLTATFVFAIPDVKGLGLIELPTNSIYVLQKAYSAMQTVSLARGKLTGTRFWLSKKEFDITRIDDNGQPVRQKQMLTVLDADIDLGALLDTGDEPQPALEAASRAVALIEAAGAVEVLDDPLAESDDDVLGSGGKEGEGSEQADPDEPLEDKRHRMSDLLHRLGLSQPARQQDFRKYGHVTYGRGWAERPSDVDQMNARLTAALTDPVAFDDEIKQANSFV
ncbi:recombination directionality factor [Paraburkholderia sp. RL17-337-BIB-A]|uniref:recombination directionality factor n=1 Tax=Paraburkholderia sp. RL17-337-BIB-A TaxID=3031636 RepID=UPI0038B864CB